MRNAYVPLFTALPLNVSFNGPPQQLQDAFLYTVQAFITGTPNGTVFLEASNDPFIPTGAVNQYRPPTNWTTISGSSFSVSASGSEMWNVSNMGYNWVRLVYTDLSGGTSTATMTATINIKGI